MATALKTKHFIHDWKAGNVQDRMALVFLMPGEFVCDWFNIEDEESRFLFRLFVNLTVYAKIGVIIAFLSI